MSVQQVPEPSGALGGARGAHPILAATQVVLIRRNTHTLSANDLDSQQETNNEQARDPDGRLRFACNGHNHLRLPLLLFPMAAPNAANSTWQGDFDNSWHNEVNWTAGDPGAGDTAFFTTVAVGDSATPLVFFPVTTTIGAITFQAGAPRLHSPSITRSISAPCSRFPARDREQFRPYAVDLHLGRRQSRPGRRAGLP